MTRQTSQIIRILALPLLAAAAARAQQTIVPPVAFVPTSTATISGDISVTSGRTSLLSSSVVTALDHTAPVTLARGGTVAVCQSSSLHVTGTSSSLLLALDRGALELHFEATPADALMTPDLRITFASPGPLDLRVRATRNGDTCVENKGKKAPILTISDQFGDSTYLLKPNQHVLFEHASLKEVVDRETTPCGCPPETPPATSIADAVLSGKPVTPKQASAQHPFPAAVSEGLAEPTIPAQAPGETHTQVSDSLAYNSATPPAPPTSASTQSLSPEDTPAPPPPQPHGVFHSIGHFFKHIFGGS